MSDRSYRLLALLFAVSAALRLPAAQDSLVGRGFAPDKVYQVHGLDSVNTFNGNLEINIPIGPTYGSNGSLSYSFVLAYNSTAWESLGHNSSFSSTSSEFIDRLITWSQIVTAEVGASDGNAGTEIVPGFDHNAGLGWMVSLGHPRSVRGTDNVPGMSYVTPDGAEHLFWDSLHGPLNGEPSMSNPNGPWYTRDGSYLRMTKDSDRKRTIAFPSGILHRISCVNIDVGKCGTIDAEWYLDEVADPYGNILVITRAPNARPTPGVTSQAAWIWTFEQSFRKETGYASGRQPYKVRTSTATYYVRMRRNGSLNSPAHMEVLLDTLSLPATGAGEPSATYTFHYDHPLIHLQTNSTWGKKDDRAVPVVIDPEKPVQCDSGPRPGVFMEVSLLTELTLPGGGGSWRFAYRDDGKSGFPPSGVRPVCFGAGDWISFETSYDAGLLAEMIYPTGGGVRYEYTRRRFPGGDCQANSGRGGRVTQQTAVSQRQLTEPDSGSIRRDVGQPWLYLAAPYPPNNVWDPNCPAFELTSTTVDPAGKATVSFYSTFANTNPQNGWSRHEYGLPITHYDEIADPDNVTLQASTYTYDCSAANLWDIADSPAALDDAVRKIVARHRAAGEPATCLSESAPNAPASDLPLRIEYQRWKFSSVFCDPGAISCQQTNRRLQKNLTRSWDVCNDNGCVRANSGPSYTLTERTNFDGLGHYRTERRSGNYYAGAFPNNPPGDPGLAARRDTRLTTTSYNNNVAFNESTETFATAPAGNWILNTYNDVTVVHDGRTTVHQYRFRPETGFLAAERLLAQNTAGENDLLRRYVRSVDDITEPVGGAFPQAHVREEYYGGDDQCLGNVTIDTAADPNIPMPQSPRYTVHRYSKNGVTSRVQYGMENGGLETVYSAAVERHTGLTTSETDAVDATTSFGYDVLGRLTSVSEELEAPTSYTYPNLALNPSNRVVSGTRTASPGGTRESRYEYDPWGRLLVIKESVAGSFNRKINAYDEMSRLTAESVVMADVPSAPADGLFFRYGYDIFGERVRATPPDNGGSDGGAKRNRLFTFYQGREVVSKTEGAATDIDSTGSVTLTRSYDSLGRLIKVSEDSDSNSPNQEVTRYIYDGDDHLNIVDSVGTDPQTRTLTTDGRGLMTEESHPELASYRLKHRYDARANVISSRIVTSTAPATVKFDRFFAYDKAEHLVGVYRSSGLIGPFGPEPGGALKSFQYQSGRLLSAGRTNYLTNLRGTSDAETQVQVMTNFAYDAAGRVTSQTVDGGSFAATTNFEYNGFGDLKSIRYPRLTGSACTATCTTVGSNHWIDANYQSGNLHDVARRGTTPGFVTSIDYHPNGMISRMSRGDGSADTQTLGDDLRPRPASMSAGGWTTGVIRYDGADQIRAMGDDRYAYDAVRRLKAARTNLDTTFIQELKYDRHGNLKSMTLPSGSDPAIGSSSATNRLSTGATYDAGGNLVSWTDPRRVDGAVLTARFDALNMMTGSALTTPSGEVKFNRNFVYDAFDERAAVIERAAASGPSPVEHWSIRGLKHELLADFDWGAIASPTTGGWTWNRDFIYAGPSLVAEVLNSGTVRHLHRDHLGSVRCVTVNGAGCTTTRKYLPFGQEFLPAADGDRMRFAGHERDDDQSAATVGDVDYMHARYYNPMTGRFLSVDPVAGSPSRPQSWNRYAYASNNPVMMIDPDGRRSTSSDQPDSDEKQTPSAQDTATEDNTTCDDSGCYTNVVAPDPAKQSNYGLNAEMRSRAAQLGLDVLDIYINGEERLATAVMGFTDGCGFADLDMQTLAWHLANVFGDDDYDRRVGLVDRKSRAYSVGFIDGQLWAVFAIWGLAREANMPKGPKPKIRGRYGDDGVLRWEPAPR